MAEILDVQDGELLKLNDSQATHILFRLFSYTFLTLVLARYPRNFGEILPRCDSRLPGDEEWRAPGHRGWDGAGWGEYVYPSDDHFGYFFCVNSFSDSIDSSIFPDDKPPKRT